jgi:tetratricopeptide (TPR) repeat protein
MHPSPKRFVRLALRPCAFVLGILLLSAPAARTQRRSGTVDVRVSDAADESPIPKADIRLYVFGEGNFSHQGYADAGGRYTFVGIAAGAYTVVAQQADYETVSERVEVFPGDTALVSISLQRKGTTPEAKSGRSVSSASLAVPTAAQKEFDEGKGNLASDPEAAIRHFRKAVEQYPKYAEAWLLMTVAHLKLNQREDAKTAIGKAIEGDPNFSQAYTLRGRMLIENREFDNAETALKESLRLNPQAWDAHFELARCYYNMGKMTKALEEGRQARDQTGSSPLTHLLLADIYLKQNQRKEALEELEGFAKADPTSSMLPRVQGKIAQLRQQK